MTSDPNTYRENRTEPADHGSDDDPVARAKRHLRDSEKKYRALFESIDEGFCVIELLYEADGKPFDYRYLETNPAFERHTGVKNAVGRRMREIAPNHETDWYQIFDRIVKTDEPVRLERRAEDVDRWFDFYALRVGDPDEHRIAAVFRDITERKRAEMSRQLLFDIHERLARRTGIDEIMAAVCARIGEHFEVAVCAFVQIDEAEENAVVAADWHRPDAMSIIGVYRIAEFVTPEFYRAARAGEAVVIRDTETDERVDTANYRALGVRSLVSVPLVREKRWTLGISVLDAGPRDWRADEVALLRELVDRMWSRIEQARAEDALRTSEQALRQANEELEARVAERTHALSLRTAELARMDALRQALLDEALARADQDPLTGLLNHRAFHRRLAETTAEALQANVSVAVAVLDLDNFKFFNDLYGHAEGDVVLRKVADRLREICRSGDAVARFGGDEFALLLTDLESSSRLEIETRLRALTGDLSFLPYEHDTPVPITLSVGVALFPDHSHEFLEVVKQADARLLLAKTGGTPEGEAQGVRAAAVGLAKDFALLDALVTAVDNKDRYTRRHSEDVMTYSLQIARELDLSPALRRTVAVAALLHDVGKIGVPDHILRKPGRLTETELAAVRQHARMGAIIVSSVPGLEDTLDAVRHHHERWDGQGYPDGLRAEQTPLLARVIAVADAFSAITTDRPYRKGMSHEKASALLEAGAGTQWDPDCVGAFLRARSTAARG